MTLAVIYDRASTMKQKDNFSRIDAREEGIRIAQRFGFEWEYQKEIGSGATLAGRSIMLSILDRIAAGEVHAIICQDLDRLARPEERSSYETIRHICLERNVKIYTQSGVIDFANDNDDLIADIKVAIAKKERKDIVKRIIRGLKERARAGKVSGSPTPFGYRFVFIQPGSPDQRPFSDLVINEEKREVVSLLFSLFLQGGAAATARHLNALGYRGQNGAMFTASTVLKAIKNPLYAGLVIWGKVKKSPFLKDYEATSVFRPDLQIISTDIWHEANEVRKGRSIAKKSPGEWGKYAFTGFIVCETCGGSVAGSIMRPKHGRVKVQYRCTQSRLYGAAVCARGKSYNHDLVAQAIVPFIADTINRQVDLIEALDQAAAKYGRTATEGETEKKLRADLLTVTEKKNRVIASIAAGVIGQDEARQTLEHLRDEEQAATRQLATISKKATIRQEYLQAIESLKQDDLESTLWYAIEHKPSIFRRILKLIFKPNSIVVRTERNGAGKWQGYLIDYQFTDDFLEVSAFNNQQLSDG